MSVNQALIVVFVFAAVVLGLLVLAESSGFHAPVVTGETALEKAGKNFIEKEAQ